MKSEYGEFWPIRGQDLPVRGGEDAHWGCIIWKILLLFLKFQNIWLFTWNEAANIVVCQATVGVGGPSTEINKPLLQIAIAILRN